MSQLSLFEAQPTKAEPRQVNLRIIRNTVYQTLRMLRRAEFMPWYDFEVKDWETRFPRLAAYLPADEADAAVTEFRREMDRLRASALTR